VCSVVWPDVEENTGFTFRDVWQMKGQVHSIGTGRNEANGKRGRW
jgi:hypothetical protein